MLPNRLGESWKIELKNVGLNENEVEAVMGSYYNTPRSAIKALQLKMLYLVTLLGTSDMDVLTAVQKVATVPTKIIRKAVSGAI